MRTRKQTRAEESSEAALSPTSSTSSPTVVSITKFEGPTVSLSTRDSDAPGAAARLDSLAQSPSKSKLPTVFQFPLVAVLSLALSQLGYTLTWAHSKGALAAHARLLSSWTDLGVIVGWRL